MATILNSQNYIEKASDIAIKYGYVLNYDNKNEIVSIQCAKDIQQTDDFSYYAKMVYDILNLADTPTIIDPDTEFQQEKLIITAALVWEQCCVTLSMTHPNQV